MSLHPLKLVLPIAVALAILPLAANADGLDYNFAQFGYGYSHNDRNDTDTHSWHGDGSVEIGSNFDVTAGGLVDSHDASSLTGQAWHLGAGFHTPIGASTDFFSEASFAHSNLDGISGDVRTWTGAVGVRSAFSPHVEGWLEAGYADNHDDQRGIVRAGRGHGFGALGAQYRFNNHWGLVAQTSISPEGHGIQFGPRFSF